ncbi:hypothetical protein ACQU0X_08535 [Pseudovibrio ascidiaceicola]|uniref:hypothetical protein n=1 Tax=Pseudovibrio ascidiaceicola TaxID=285279 RepID=UPI003D360880
MNAKDVADAAAITSAFGSVFQFLPEIAALFAIAWTAIRIYEWARVRLFGYSGEIKP